MPNGIGTRERQGADLTRLRDRIRDAARIDEPAAVSVLLETAPEHLSEVRRNSVVKRAQGLVRRSREAGSPAGTLDAFLQEFSLSNREGVALMCLAEALLRVPDSGTADKLIAEKVRGRDWGGHLGQSGSIFVNASVWGLMLTGRALGPDPEAASDEGAFLRRLTARLGEPVVRGAMLQAMRILGRQYVFGRTVAEALRRAGRGRHAGRRHSFDLLGEGARTHGDAKRHFSAYAKAIGEMGGGGGETPAEGANGISVKLSALHPRFELAQQERLDVELAPRLKALAVQAKKQGLALSIDAEEAFRLEPTLDLFEGLARDPDLAGWGGLGFVLQAYQKRAPAVAEWLIALARETRQRLLVRLVKGAYWDTEIKHAQERGLPGYPVFTRKANTDLSYEICAARLLSSPAEVFPQFASHNAHTMCLVDELARAAGGAAFEFQRLHGMGEALHSQFGASAQLRTYAPVGSHRDLLPYLVRRLLENGANSSFVNRFMDREVDVDELVRDPLDAVRSHDSHSHPDIPRPRDLYFGREGDGSRLNAAGIDLDDPRSLGDLAGGASRVPDHPRRAGPIVNGREAGSDGAPILCPADRDVRVGSVAVASPDDVDAALESAAAAQPDWNALGGEQRADVLEQAAELLEARCSELVGLIAFEAGRTLDDGLAETREAVDFCRYYAMMARRQFGQSMPLPGPTGERNELSLDGRGVFACISPWNFPLAIFTGQVAAALAAGNAVVAKPAEQTPLVAAETVRRLHEAGVPPDILHLLPGSRAVGSRIVQDPRTDGVAFTGSIEVAWRINRDLARRNGPIAPLIAETGGQNAMLVDSTALPEQVVDDVVASAFRSAGQRCSALRILYLQDEIADAVLDMLSGAMRALVIGMPWDPATDVGPVIDREALDQLERHRSAMLRTARLVCECELPPECARGSFLAPCAFEIGSMRELDREVFGPVLHVVRYSAHGLADVLNEINSSGYGLTLGVHSRREGFAREVFRGTAAGNVYVNRNIIGAVVGVNPFGGRGLSGTGPKAGGPHYLLRFASERVLTDNLTAKGGNADLLRLGS